MAGFDELVPPHIRALGRYIPGKPVRDAEASSGVKCIKLASNENPFGPSPKAIEAMRRAAPQASFYPDNQNSELSRLIAERHGLSTENVLITNGSTSFLDIAARTLLAPGLNAVTSARSFIIYPLVTKTAGGMLTETPMRGDTIDLEAMLAAITPQTRIVFLANPNNPTGTMVSAGEIDRFLAHVPEHVLTILDEAYSDFASYFAERRRIEYSHAVDNVRAGRRVLVLRTFSKAHGLAGLRVGYGLAPAEIIRYFARVRTVFSVSSVAEAAAIAALSDSEHSARTIRNNARGAKFLTSKLRELGLRAVPTCANFIYFEVNEPADDFAQRMESKGVIVRPLTAWGAPNAIRVTIGTPEQNQMFVNALQRVLHPVQQDMAAD